MFYYLKIKMEIEFEQFYYWQQIKQIYNVGWTYFVNCEIVYFDKLDSRYKFNLT